MNRFRLFAIVLLLSGCVKVGPDFVRPEAQVSADWLEAADNRVTSRQADSHEWWRVFDDPVLNRLIDTAYRENLSLRIAGVRVLEARAQLGVAVGQLYPQKQQLGGNLQYYRVSEHSLLFGGLFRTPNYNQADSTITANWEIDFWGRFRRSIESADAGWIATVADYDNALVSLTADVATNYILIRTLEKRIEIALQNVETQKESLRIAEARFQIGTTSERDVEQARTVLNDTLATVPTLQSQLRQTQNALSVLLGSPPGNLKEMLAGSRGIPGPPLTVAVGIPADLLRRRPDIRSAEYRAAAQCAEIGVAKADLFPVFSLNGMYGYLSTNMGRNSLGDINHASSRQYTVGPGITWNVLSYGRITNNVRVQDARFQQLIISYQSTVLKAQQEVEDGLTAFLRAQERAEFLTRSVEAARRSLGLAMAQYREGVMDYTTVLTTEQALLTEQDNLANTLGSIAGNLVATYRALGGGWEIRTGKELVPGDIKEAMAKRTNWGSLLEPAVYIPGPSETERSLVRLPDW